MKYDWDKIFDDQQKSGLTIKRYCEMHHLSPASFYKARRTLRKTNDDLFSSVKIAEPSVISLSIDGHQLTIEATLLSQVLEALK